MYKCKHFKIKELVSEQVYRKYGENAWTFFDQKILLTLDNIRDFFGKPMTVNNWAYGGSLSQRGFRCNMDQIVKDKTEDGRMYCSQHCLGRAFDFNIKGMDCDDVRRDILNNQDLFPHITRMEHRDNSRTWVHIDIANIACDSIYVFKA